jgi:hypothetical protein
MALTFDATLKDMGRDSPQGFLAAFDRPPALPVKLLNVDLSTVTKSADLIVGLGQGNRILFPGKSGKDAEQSLVVPAGNQAFAAQTRFAGSVLL